MLDTGIFVRAIVDGKYGNVDVGRMTTEQFQDWLDMNSKVDQFSVDAVFHYRKLAIGLHNWIITHIVSDDD